MDRDSLIILGSLGVWLGAIMVFLLMTRSLMNRMGRLFHTRMREALEAAEHIVRTGHAPYAWQQAFVALDPWPCHLRAGMGFRPQAGTDREQLCVARLDTLIRFFEKTPAVQGADTRALLLAELRTQHARWIREGVSFAPMTEEQAPSPASLKGEDVP